jgi:hypothetical protein
MESQMNAAGAAEEVGRDDEYAQRAQPSGHSLMDVLMPAHPPEPKNARIVRLFDIEGAAKDEPQPIEYVSAAAVRREARSGRRASREMRGQSLLAAAGLV